MSVLLSETLPIELTNGNTGRSGAWFSSAKLRKQYEAELSVTHRREPFPHPVTVHVTRILGPGQRLWDSSSILRGNYKEIEDAMVAIGWFHDDSPKWIRHTLAFQDASRRGEGPAVMIEVFSSEVVK